MAITGNERIPLLHQGSAIRLRDVLGLVNGAEASTGIQLPLLQAIPEFGNSIDVNTIIYGAVDMDTVRFPVVSGGVSVTATDILNFADVPLSVTVHASSVFEHGGGAGINWTIGDHLMTGWQVDAGQNIELVVTEVFPVTPSGPLTITASVDQNQTALGDVTAINLGTKVITVDGDLTGWVSAGMRISLINEDALTAVLTVTTAVFDTDHTNVTVSTAIPVGLGDPAGKGRQILREAYAVVGPLVATAFTAALATSDENVVLIAGGVITEIQVVGSGGVVEIGGDTYIFIRGGEEGVASAAADGWADLTLTIGGKIVDFDIVTPGVSRAGDFSAEAVSPSRGDDAEFTVRI